MIKNTFQHISGIGSKKEKDLWGSGIMCWNDIAESKALPLPPKTASNLKAAVKESLFHYSSERAAQYFYNQLPSRIHWRLFPDFIDSAVYLDIETTGLDISNGSITTIALYDGIDIFHYTKGINLDDFLQDIQKYSLIITYNGKSFDIPYIENFFNIKLHHAQIDLRYVLGGLGFKGGLKGCEKAFGIDRKELDGVDGYFAVILWEEYIRTGNQKALETLLAYNIEDVVNLDFLMISAFNMMIKETEFSHYRLKHRPVPEKPFYPHMPIVNELKRKHGMFQSRRF